MTLSAGLVAGLVGLLATEPKVPELEIQRPRRPAVAEPEAAAVEVASWSETCPDPARLHARVRDELERAGAPAGWLRVEAAVYPKGTGHVLELGLTRGEVGERHRVEALDCVELVDAAALLVGLALRPELGLWSELPDEVAVELAAIEVFPRPPVQRPHEPAPKVLEPAPVELASAPAEDWELRPLDQPEPEPEPARRGRWPSSELERGLDLHVRGGPSFNLYPNVAAAPRLRLSTHGAWASVGGGVSGVFGGRFGDPSLGSGRVDGGSLDVHGCGLPIATRRWRLSACANLGLGLLRGRGIDVPTPTARVAPWLWAGGELGVSWWPRPRLGVELSGELATSLTRPAFHALDAQFITGGVFGGVSLGLVFELWGRKLGDTDPRSRGQARAP